MLRAHRESGMLAIALESFLLYIVDSDTKVVIRKFQGHSASINDMTFSPDSRWLISASMDSSIKVWDIPSSYMIDHFKVERPCISLSMSPTGDFLATAHVNNLGIYLWSNKTLFNQISLRSLNPKEEAPYVGLPSNACDEMSLEEAVQEMEIDADDNAKELGEEIDAKYESPMQLSNELITMSGLAASRWQNLLDLELIKKRNKPKAPPKVPKQAPFFLPTVAGLDLKFDMSEEAKKLQQEAETSRILKAKTISNLTQFGQLLQQTAETSNYENCVEYLKKLGPSMIDFEIKSLHPLGGGNWQIMVQFLKTIDYMFSTNLNFELAQSYLSVLLRAHGLNLLESPEVVEALRLVASSQQKSWDRLENKLMFGMGVVAALRNFVQ